MRWGPSHSGSGETTRQRQGAAPHPRQSPHRFGHRGGLSLGVRFEVMLERSQRDGRSLRGTATLAARHERGDDAPGAQDQRRDAQLALIRRDLQNRLIELGLRFLVLGERL